MHEKRLRMANEADFARAQAKLFPEQPHQPIAIRAAARIAMTAGGQDQSNLLRRSGFRWDGASHLIGQSLHHQRMRWINVVVVEHEFGARTTRLTDGITQCLALQEVELERGWKNEDFGRRMARNHGS
jgi:hypothetical protein